MTAWRFYPRHLLIWLVWIASLAGVTFAAEPADQSNKPPANARKIYGRTATEWLAHLRRLETPAERMTAIYSLGECGIAATPAVPELLRAFELPGDREAERLLVLDVLARIGEAAAVSEKAAALEQVRAARPPLLALVQNRRAPTSERVAACDALVRMHPKGEAVTQSILDLLRGRDEQLRAGAAEAAVTLALHGRRAKAVEALQETMLRGQEVEIIGRGFRCLGVAGVEPLLVVLEKSRDPRARIAAADALHHMGETAARDERTKLLLLHAAAEDRDPDVQTAARRAVIALYPTDPSALGAYVRVFDLKEQEGDPLQFSIILERMEVLMRSGLAAMRVLPSLLQHPNATVRFTAVMQLTELGRASLSALPQVVAMLNDANPKVREMATASLGHWGSDAKDAVPALLTARNAAARNEKWRRVIDLAVLRITDPLEVKKYESDLQGWEKAELLEALQAPVAATELKCEALHALARYTKDPAVIDALLAALKDAEVPVRVAAAEVLMGCGEAAAPAVDVFIDWLATRDPQRHVAALKALAALHEHASKALLPLVTFAGSESMDHDDAKLDVPHWAGLALKPFGEKTAPWFRKALEEGDAAQQVRVCKALGAMGPAGATNVPELLELAEGADLDVARAALRALKGIGPGARPALRQLIRLLTSTDVEVRRHTTWALRDIGLDPAAEDTHHLVEALIVTLLDPDPDVALGGHAALTALGPRVLPELRELLKMGEGEQPYWALRVMARLKADPEVVIPEMLKFALPGKKGLERGTAAELLGYYAPEHTGMIPDLIRVLADREKYVAKAAARTLKKFGEAALPDLDAAVRGRNPLLRHRALALIAEMRQ